MRHYEIIILVHPDQSEQVSSMLGRYKSLVEKDGGKTHRVEDWGRRQLAYQIKRAHKAHYVLMNIEAGQETVQELESSFLYNDAVLRYLVVRVTKVVTDESPMMEKINEEKKREEERDTREREIRRRYKERKDKDGGDSDDTAAEADAAADADTPAPKKAKADISSEEPDSSDDKDEAKK